MSAPVAERRPGPPYVTGLFEDEAHAQEAFDRLVEDAFDPHEVGVVRVEDPHRAVENELRRGSVLVGVTAEGARADMARRALEQAGARRIFG